MQIVKILSSSSDLYNLLPVQQKKGWEKWITSNDVFKSHDMDSPSLLGMHSNIVRVMKRYNLKSILNFGNGSINALLDVIRLYDLNGISAYSMCVSTELTHNLEINGIRLDERLFCTSLSTFMNELERAGKWWCERCGDGGIWGTQPMFIDCIAWPGIIQGPEHIKDWQVVSSEIQRLLKYAPSICKSLIIAGDFTMGAMLDRVIREIGIDVYGLTLIPGLESHYMISWDVSTITNIQHEQ